MIPVLFRPRGTNLVRAESILYLFTPGAQGPGGDHIIPCDGRSQFPCDVRSSFVIIKTCRPGEGVLARDREAFPLSEIQSIITQ